ncbi:hypothetical protein SB48_HM08orf02451 [Heyndrickxia coagulans]|uniref:Uncharacterized protein n=1 Tax=Heyndrickxia coagulans TaxID=1398 RepID=A0AAN0WBT4_HEYCO|nr:hypothetical protein SB48_HM08orf02451 [Heyndrickxia coagulans]
MKTIPLRALVVILLKPPADFQVHLKICNQCKKRNQKG